MKKNSLLTFVVILLQASIATAQKADTVRARVSYTYSIVENTSKPDSTREEQMMLLLGKNASLYTSLDKVVEAEKRKKEMEEMAKQFEQGLIKNIKMSPGKRTTGNDIYIYRNEKKMFTKQRIVNNYLTEDSMPAIDWKLSNDTLTISGLKCQKATAYFKGRDYTVWYCPEIPFSSGPWKLNGLPGLIVQASDLKKEINFKFDGFEVVNASEIKTQMPVAKPQAVIPGQVMVIGGYEGTNLTTASIIELPKDAIKTTEKEINNLKEALRKDPAGFINSSMGGMSGDSKVVFKAAPGSTTVKPATVLNTIELPEKK
ncbi:GLPGLI family protein [Pedobacter duraquae]|uniref:GLPGLI family protein n=1 Tax=Pedobacter duraquae TaxID=425511 RepID=A0A4R6IMA3_9SPHI|nr:GLPGLI family protein [Pedobacter duraquae]TDO23075.1 GLPGLI family protein [Pedobacter duraquae]